MFFEFLIGITPKQAECTKKNFNIMEMEKVRNKLNEKNVPAEMVTFLEQCLREKESVQMMENGRKVEDPNHSRLSW
jgi:hypothetical protein